jgi:uncharacterized protein YutE (UPF0331/DUF86 family)
MKERLRLVAARIRQEIQELPPVVEKCQRAMRTAKSALQDQDLYLDSAALNLHDFYSGVERTLLHIAGAIDRAVPTGNHWHQELLLQMRTGAKSLRPAVLTEESVECLKEYLGFRHVVRNVYTFKFDPDRIDRLVDRLPACFEMLKRQFYEFADQLDAISGEISEL